MSLNSYAVEDIVLDFERVSVNELSRVVLKDILQQDFILSDSVLNDPKLLTISLQTRSREKLLPVFKDLLLLQGFQVQDKKSILFIDKVRDLAPGESVFTYAPKFRDVNYLLQSVATVFDDAKFTKPLNMQNQNTNFFQSDHLLFKGTNEQIKSLEKVLLDLDTKEDQLQVNAYMYEVSTSDKSQSAFSLALNLLGGALNVNLASQALTNVLALKVSDLSLAFSALNSDTRFNSISSPTLLVKHASTGRISVGADVPVLGNVSYQQNGQALQAVEYKQSGVILDVSPRFHRDNIELTIKHQISNFIATTNGVNNSPTLIKREFNTVVDAQHNDLILIGGLSERSQTKTRSFLPFLPWLSNSKNNDAGSSDILLVLHVTRI